MSSLARLSSIVSQKEGFWTRDIKPGEGKSSAVAKMSFELKLNGSGSVPVSMLLKSGDISELNSS